MKKSKAWLTVIGVGLAFAAVFLGWQTTVTLSLGPITVDLEPSLEPGLLCTAFSCHRFRANDTARICTVGNRLIIHETPGLYTPEVTRLHPGTLVTIIGGPICKEDYIWWKIETAEGTTGWAAEGSATGGAYYLCPDP